MAKQRNPRYPSIPLEDALNRVEEIFKKENVHPMAAEVAVSHIGYSSLNGASAKVLAALKYYGLLKKDAEGVAVSTNARTIIADKFADDQSERNEALIACLVSNDVFKELYEKFKNSSSELNIQSHLMKQGFDPTVASSAASIYKNSVDFVLSCQDALLEIEDTEAESEVENSPSIKAEEYETAGQSSIKTAVGGRPSRQLYAEIVEDDMLPLSRRYRRGKIMRQDTYTLDNGELTLSWPSGMSLDEVEDFEMWIEMMKKKVRRAVEKNMKANIINENDI